MAWFSAAQCVGYLAFMLGVIAFSQRKDQRLRFFNGIQCLIYALHFFLLGNPPAAASGVISGIRSLLAVKFRSRFLVVIFIGVNVLAGVAFAKGTAGWLPVAASSLATISMFLMRGIWMRLVLIGSSVCWLANNILSRSIGGTALETVLIVANCATIARILLTEREKETISPADSALISES